MGRCPALLVMRWEKEKRKLTSEGRAAAAGGCVQGEGRRQCPAQVRDEMEKKKGKKT